MAVVTADSLRVIHRDQGEVHHSVQTLELQSGDVDLGGYDHFMLKEIFEQPETLRNAMRGRLSLDEATAHFGGLNLTPQQLRSVNRILAHRLRHQLALGLGRRVPDRGIRPASRSKWNTPASCATAIRRSTTTRWCSPSRKAAKRPTRWPRCAK